jgi:predicted nucleotide-binding protein
MSLLCAILGLNYSNKTMTKKSTHPIKVRTALIIPKEEFKSQIIEQISQGKQFGIKNITTENQLSAIEKEFDIWDDYNNELLKSSFNNTGNEYRNSYKSSGQMIGVSEVMRGISIHNTQYRLKTLKERIEAKINELESLLAKVNLIHSEVEETRTTIAEKEASIYSKDTVFIIHGHDDSMKKAVQLFISRAGLKDIVLHEQPDKSRTVIEKLIEEGNSASYVIALLSPDDTQEDGTVRARQNVVLEIGYFIGRLGREKVRLLRKGEVVIPSDLQGILFENFDNEGAWRIKILKEMHAVGLPIDLTNAVQKF